MQKGDDSMLKYEDPTTQIAIVFTRQVLTLFDRNRQLTSTDPEAGGQLFASFDGNTAYVEEATGPRPTDLRTRFGFRPDRKAEQKEIHERFERGLHYIGDWHTHPTNFPWPSGEDVASIRAAVNRSKHELKGFLLIIVGNAAFPRGLFVTLETGKSSQNLQPARRSDESPTSGVIV